MMFFNIFAGFVLLFIGGESLVRGAVKIARDLKISPLIIGVTVVAYGTSSPELLITLQSVLKGFHEIALGNVIGSNIANILLVLGIAAVIYPIKVSKALVRFDLRYVFIASFALLFFVLSGSIGRIEGIIFIFILIVYTISTIKKHGREEVSEMENNPAEIEEQFFFLKVTFPVAIMLVVLGISYLSFGAHILVQGASNLARQFDISESVIAVTIVAIGGSAPELFTSVVAAMRKHSDLAIGNVIGSNLFNILGVLGISGLIRPISVVSTFSGFDIWVMVSAVILLYYFVRKKFVLSRLAGFIFLFFYALYIAFQIL